MIDYTKNQEFIDYEGEKNMQTMFCPHCGKKVSGPAAFCPDCGNRLQTEGEGTKETKVAAPAPRLSAFQTWEALPSTQAFRKRYKILYWVFRSLPMFFILIFVLCIVTLKDIAHNYVILDWCALLAGAFAFFDTVYDGLHRTRASFLCAHWLKTQKAEPIEELRFFLKAFAESDASKGPFVKTNLPEESKRAVYFLNNPSRKKIEVGFTCLNVIFCIATGIAFGLFLASAVFSTVQKWKFFNKLTTPLLIIFLGFGVVWLIGSLVKALYVDELETKWYQKVAPDIPELMQQLYKKK